jgi:hypothetical protein
MFGHHLSLKSKNAGRNCQIVVCAKIQSSCPAKNQNLEKKGVKIRTRNIDQNKVETMELITKGSKKPKQNSPDPRSHKANKKEISL